ncbi:MAG: phosphomannomutase/phosphoglucomutase [Gammaproteobacteria bacterium]|nr:phosphomannomutase/phosphoglucomutase [Gammaproteobacteria bacterium]MYF02144.1 phosphomannomutase/phosphoglucomutase [Gammaproteobacteria bacterium]MYI76532.1 phosphomannomutase/phosphoglucomutase [Gammaproteobacteria bacterium]
MSNLPLNIFRAYDVRGRVNDELTEANTRLIGQAFANRAATRGHDCVLVGGDVRCSTETLRTALQQGLNDGGVNVIDIGTVPTPVLYFAIHELKVPAGIVITGSHNPPEYNGLKFVLDYVPFAADELLDLHRLITNDSLTKGSGNVSQQHVLDSYVDRIIHDIKVERSLHIAVDCGNGVTGVLVPRLFEALGCKVVPMFNELDGTFPNHHPDPVDPKNLQQLLQTVNEQALDFGIAFDGDGDRIGVVTKNGTIVSADMLLAYLAKDILRHRPGAPIVLDVKCGTNALNSIHASGGQAVLEKTGHTNIKAKIREIEAPLGGEFSGHICFADRWYGFDDALYTACRFLESVSRDSPSLMNFLHALPPTSSTPEIEVQVPDSEKFDLVAEFGQECSFDQGEVIAIDGVRVNFPDAWGLIRASNTSPKIVMRFEASTPNRLKETQKLFFEQLRRVAPHLEIPEVTN